MEHSDGVTGVFENLGLRNKKNISPVKSFLTYKPVTVLKNKSVFIIH